MSAFHAALHTSPRVLEDLHILAMSSGFDEACRGVEKELRIEIAIAGDRSNGGFVHRERQMVGFTKLYNHHAEMLGRAKLPENGSFPSFGMESDESSMDSGMDLKAVLAQFDDQDESLSRGIVISDDEEVDMEICSTVSPVKIVQSSRSWVSFEDFAVAEDTSVDKLDKIYIRHSSDMSIDNIPGAFREDKVAITSQPPSASAVSIAESEVLGLMGFGHVKIAPPYRIAPQHEELPIPSTPTESMPSTPLTPFYHPHHAQIQLTTPVEPTEDIASFLSVYRNAFNNIADNLEKHGSAFSPFATFRPETILGAELQAPRPMSPCPPVFVDTINHYESPPREVQMSSLRGNRYRSGPEQDNINTPHSFSFNFSNRRESRDVPILRWCM